MLSRILLRSAFSGTFRIPRVPGRNNTLKVRASLTRLSHRPPTAAADLAALTPLFLAFDPANRRFACLDVFQHAVAQKPSKKCLYINHLHHLATNSCETTGLKFCSPSPIHTSETRRTQVKADTGQHSGQNREPRTSAGVNIPHQRGRRVVWKSHLLECAIASLSYGVLPLSNRGYAITPCEIPVSAGIRHVATQRLRAVRFNGLVK